MNELRTRWIISLKDKVNSDGAFAWLFNLRFHVSCGGFPGSTTLIQIKNKVSEWVTKITMDRSYLRYVLTFMATAAEAEELSWPCSCSFSSTIFPSNIDWINMKIAKYINIISDRWMNEWMAVNATTFRSIQFEPTNTTAWSSSSMNYEWV